MAQSTDANKIHHDDSLKWYFGKSDVAKHINADQIYYSVLCSVHAEV